VRLVHYEPITPLKSLKSNLVGKFAELVRTSLVKPLLTQISFKCASCSRRQTLKAHDGKYIKPAKCTTPGCKTREFFPERGTQGDTQTVDWQKIRIQEKFADDRLDSGRVPRTVECELTHDLVDAVLPGDVVNCTGVVKVLQANDMGPSRGKSQNAMYMLYLDVVSISRVGGSPTAGGSQGSSGEHDTGNDTSSKDAIQFNHKDLQFIRELFKEPQLFRLIVNSFCPTIYGNELIKAGILLCQFGGKRRTFQDGKNHIPIRSDPHILVVGDPGMGKSQMLNAAVNVAPRGVYVCGSSGTSACGLTVTICKDSATGDFALEAGALVLGDQGCCCIDEFDKMSSDHNALLEAMEQQSISIAKAGIVCSLPARTSVIAAANPVGGHYNKSKTVSENLKMGSALLSRFDLIFIMLDKPNLQRDQFLSEHIMNIHSAANDTKETYNSQSNPTPSQLPASQGDARALFDASDNPSPLLAKVRLNRGEQLDLVPAPLLRKYIAYARKYVQPVLSPEACTTLQDFYLTLRNKRQAVDSTPITTRQLESLIRLAEARARMELRELVTQEDAMDIVHLMQYSLFEAFEDGVGDLDFSRSQMGTGMSRRAEPKRFISHLQKMVDETYNSTFTYQQLYQAAQVINLQYDDFQDFVDSLNNQNYLLKIRAKVYRLTTSCM
ncbi:MCM2/3/5 family-domain-containing protein, partial [Dimargaris cristalligena]